MKWEGSRADKKLDKREAKKRGIPLSKWEGSEADEKMDRKAKKRKKKHYD